MTTPDTHGHAAHGTRHASGPATEPERIAMVPVIAVGLISVLVFALGSVWALRIRSKGINLIACPSCSRQEFDVIATVNALEQRIEDIKEPLDVAVIGCCVNGPGEAKAAHIGLAGGNPNLLYINGRPDHKLGNEQLVDEIERVIREELQRRRERGVSTPEKKVFPIKQTG